MALALLEKRREAIRLRKAGLPYSDIRKQLGVSKSSLSYWLRSLEMTEPHIKAITANWISRRVESYRQTTKKRVAILEKQRLVEARQSLGKITKRDFLVAGLFLYLGEGQKGDRWTVGIANSDPEVIRFGVRWLTHILGTPKEKVYLKVHLYKDMDAEKEIGFWSNLTTIPLTQFKKPYIKNSLRSSLDYPTHGHGTCNILVGSGPLKQRIMAELKTVMMSLNTGV